MRIRCSCGIAARSFSALRDNLIWYTKNHEVCELITSSSPRSFITSRRERTRPALISAMPSSIAAISSGVRGSSSYAASARRRTTSSYVSLGESFRSSRSAFVSVRILTVVTCGIYWCICVYMLIRISFWPVTTAIFVPGRGNYRIQQRGEVRMFFCTAKTAGSPKKMGDTMKYGENLN